MGPGKSSRYCPPANRGVDLDAYLVNVDELGTPQAQDSGSPAAPFAALQPGRHLWLPHRQLPQNARLVHTAQPGEVRHDFVHTGRGAELCESFRFGYLLAAARVVHVVWNMRPKPDTSGISGVNQFCTDARFAKEKGLVRLAIGSRSPPGIFQSWCGLLLSEGEASCRTL